MTLGHVSNAYIPTMDWYCHLTPAYLGRPDTHGMILLPIIIMSGALKNMEAWFYLRRLQLVSRSAQGTAIFFF